MKPDRHEFAILALALASWIAVGAIVWGFYTIWTWASAR